MSAALGPAPRGFAMPRPGAAQPDGSPPRAAPPGATKAGGAAGDEDAAPAAAADAPLAPDDTVDLAVQEQAQRISQLLGRLDAEFIGLTPVKDRVREIAALLLIDRLRG